MKEAGELLERIGYVFADNDLLTKALTHSSYSSEHRMNYSSNNERLEFIGDAFVDAVIGAELFNIMQDAPEGVLSKNRADVVREESLADVARNINLGDYIYMGRGEEITGGRNKDSILADTFEALIGAIILDGGYEAGREVILKLLHDKIPVGVGAVFHLCVVPAQVLCWIGCLNAMCGQHFVSCKLVRCRALLCVF